ncbi:MAG: T9SS type A sorting domain-containing protein, partial [Lentimicrobium sp.]|nr:T9SS type A sorting domain-containing protein [Lentimicrobium sp.]
MKNNSLLFLMLLPAFSLFSQNYMISFSGSGETTVIDSVIVYNFQQNISLTLQGNDTLHLVENLGIGQPSRHKPINIYPNPTANSSRLELFCYRAEKAVLQVYNTSGILIYQEGLLVEQGDNTFTLEGLRQGNYLIRINSPSEEYSGQLIAAGSGSGPVKLTKNSTVSLKSLPTDDKNAGSIIQMLYHSGERILLKSFAG